MKKSKFLIKLTGLALDTIFKICKARLHIHGEDKIPNKPSMFVTNHFTRMETFFLPYVLTKITGKNTLNLAFGELFGGGFGNYLSKLGAVSTKDPNRRKIICEALVKGDMSCVIYPEGQMIKDKRSVEKGKLMVFNAGIRRPPHTGAAIYALISEFYREKIRYFNNTGNRDGINEYKEYFELVDDDIDKILKLETNIVPANITYSPIRARRNILNKIAEKLAGDVPSRVAEELEVEGAMLVDGVDIDITFGTPIPLRGFMDKPGYLKKIQNNKLYLSDEDVKNHLGFKKDALALMYKYMHSIYCLTTINFEHVFSYILAAYRSNKIEESDFNNRVLLAIHKIKDMPLKLHPEFEEIKSKTIFNENEVFTKYDEFLDFLESDSLATVTSAFIIKDKEKFSKLYEFHLIRKDNIVEVLRNEIMPIKPLVRELKKIMMLPSFLVKKRINKIRR